MASTISVAHLPRTLPPTPALDPRRLFFVLVREQHTSTLARHRNAIHTWLGPSREFIENSLRGNLLDARHAWTSSPVTPTPGGCLVAIALERSRGKRRVLECAGGAESLVHGPGPWGSPAVTGGQGGDNTGQGLRVVAKPGVVASTRIEEVKQGSTR